MVTMTTARRAMTKSEDSSEAETRRGGGGRHRGRETTFRTDRGTDRRTHDWVRTGR
jgi:hypothetical protein